VDVGGDGHLGIHQGGNNLDETPATIRMLRPTTW
jgi:hypothetical protein